MVRRSLDLAADEKVRAATGEGRDHWFSRLDSAGATGWTHTQMARFLVADGVDGWWAQSITVAYEQERGLRLPGQRPDGTFEASASATIAAPLADLWPHLVDDAKRRAWAGAGWTLTGATEGTSVRLAGPDDARVVIGFHTPAAVAAAGKVRVAVAQSRIADPAGVTAAKAHWKAALARLASAAAGAADATAIATPTAPGE